MARFRGSDERWGEGDPRTNKRYRVSFSIDYLLSRGYAWWLR